VNNNFLELNIYYLLDKNKKTSKVLKWLNAFSVYGIVKIKVFKN
jgi:hypothetical protein